MKHMAPDAVYILNRRAYKESSLLLDVFSYQFGRQSVLAQGALKSKKGWAALLQVFQPLLMTWTGRSTLKTLVSLEAPSEAIQLQNERLYSAYYLNELILKLLTVSADSGQGISHKGTAQGKLFLAYANTLADLQQAETIEQSLRLFEYVLLEELGIFPDCNVDINGLQISSELFYQLQNQQGFQPVFPNTGQDKHLKPVIQGCYLQLLQTELDKLYEFSAEAQRDALRQLKNLMRVLIDDALGGQEIKSRALFHRYQPNRSIS